MRKNCELIDALEYNSKKYAEKIAFIEYSNGREERSISYSKLYEKISELGEKFLKAGLEGEKYALYFQAGIDSVISLYACFYAGVTPIIRSFSPVISEERFKSQINTLFSEHNEICGVISTKNILSLIEKNYEGCLELIDIDGEFDKVVKSKKESPHIEADLIQLTSGSTSSSKGVKISFDNFIYNINLCKELWQMNSDSVMVSWAPHSHVFGLMISTLLPSYCGSKSVLMQASDFSENPLTWIECMSKYKATHTGAPNFAFNACTSAYSDELMKDIDLSSLLIASSGGEVVNSNTQEEFYEKFSKHGFKLESFCPSYGMTENSGVVCSTSKEYKAETCLVDYNEFINNKIIEVHNSTFNKPTCKLISIGKAFKETDIIISDIEESIDLPDCKIGEIIISSPALTEGYIYPEEKSSFEIRPGSDKVMKRFFRTGDLGFIKNKSLYVTGRLKESVVIRGKNYSPYDIEVYSKQIDKDESLGKNAAFSVTIDSKEKVILFQEILKDLNEEKRNIISEKIKECVKFNLHIDIDEIIFLKENEIPRTGSGKVKRVECRNRYFKNLKNNEKNVDFELLNV